MQLLAWISDLKRLHPVWLPLLKSYKENYRAREQISSCQGLGSKERRQVAWEW